MTASAYRAVTVTGEGRFEVVERRRHEPPPGQVRIGVEACGICHTDALAVEGRRPGPSAPIVPGHEIIGVIEASVTASPGVEGRRTRRRRIARRPGRPVRVVSAR